MTILKKAVLYIVYSLISVIALLIGSRPPDLDDVLSGEKGNEPN